MQDGEGFDSKLEPATAQAILLRMFFSILLSSSLLMAPPVQGEVPSNDDEPYKLADAYLKALAGQGDQAAREYHLGGMTFMAQTVGYDSAKVIKRDPPRRDKGNLEDVVKFVNDIDKAGRKALDKMAAGAGGDESTGEITAEKAEKLMAPAKQLMDKFKVKFPTFHWVARAEKGVYWHPKNPIRPLLERTKKRGPFDLEVHRFTVEVMDGPLKTKKTWPLKILRLKVGDDFDTGWKILPAADWNPDE